MMTERRLTVDLALATTKSLLQLTVIENGTIKFTWSQKTSSQLNELFEGWPRRVDPALTSMRDLLATYHEQFPRLPGQAKQRFVDLFYTPNSTNPEQASLPSDKLTAMKRVVVADATDPIEVWQSFCGSLSRTAEYVCVKFTKLDDTVRTFKTCRAELRQLKEARVTAKLNQTPEEDLNTRARRLLQSKDKLREGILSCGEDKRKDYYKEEFGPIIGVPERTTTFDWARIKAACHDRNFYGTLQEFDDEELDLEEVPELQTLFDAIMAEMEALPTAGGSGSSQARKAEFLGKQATSLLQSFNVLDIRITTTRVSDLDIADVSSDIWDEVTRKQTIEDITVLLSDLRKLEMEGVTTTITEAQVDVFTRVKLNFQKINKSLELADRARRRPRKTGRRTKYGD